VKICGLRTTEAALAAAQAGADLLGFNFAPVSKRRVDPVVARAAIDAVRSQAARVLAAGGTPGPLMAGVFVDQPIDEVAELVHVCGLDYVQLSGDEDAGYCRAIAARSGAAVIKTVRLTGPPDEQQVERYTGDGGVALVLADAPVAGSWGGSGQAWDWGLAAGLAARHPVLLAGGLTPGNVAAAVAAVRPWGVDVASGVETDGLTDPAKVEAFVKNAIRAGDLTPGPFPSREGERCKS
jgi:phosphoribosylanthranilate isomerase